MCGIAGILDPAAADLGATVDRMLDVMRHRGPDDEAVLIEAPFALGHLRLSIIDLDPRSAQPMLDASGRYALTYNGEVYNYIELRAELEAVGTRFRTTSDSEVLLEAYVRWGAECLDRLNGMFAFAVFDRVAGRLFCARDRLGVKPFVYVHDGGRFAFASEHKALVAAGLASGEIDPNAVYEYLARGYLTGERSFFAGVTPLRPGHALEVDATGALRTWRWWNPDTSPDEATGEGDWPERIAALVEDSVRLRLRSDVPLGAHLSGGLDSSAVVAAAARLGTRIETFTGAFPEDADGDERRYSRAVVDMYGLPCHEREIAIDELAEQWTRLLWHLDEPIAGPGAFPQLLVSDLAGEAGMKVVLGGQGGDELFGGYLRHRVLFHRRRLVSGTLAERAGSAWRLGTLVVPELARIRRTSSRVQDRALEPAFLDRVDPDLRRASRQSRMGARSAAELMVWDLQNYLPALLQVEDRTSMAASLESRTPLLDYRLVELALRIPDAHRFHGTEPKQQLRAATRAWLPPEVAVRSDKRGFPTPLQHWRTSPALRPLVESLTTPAGDGIFTKELLARRDRLAPSELWSVIMINGWLRAWSS